jgi:dipeptidase E
MLPIMRLLLLSSSTLFGSGYLDYCADAIATFFGPSVSRVLFVPYAVHDRDAYAAKVRERFDGMRLTLDSVHDAAGGPLKAVERAEAIFIGGGNTFRLIDALWNARLVEPIRARVRGGMPYLGSSAGSNAACPTLKTTNDMPIVQPPTFEALDLVPFQVNPHYVDPVPGSTHMGETREERIREFHEENGAPVVGLREGAWLEVEPSGVWLRGSNGARVFGRGQAPTEFHAGAKLDVMTV